MVKKTIIRGAHQHKPQFLQIYNGEGELVSDMKLDGRLFVVHSEKDYVWMNKLIWENVDVEIKKVVLYKYKIVRE